MKQTFPITTKNTKATPIELVTQKQFSAWLKKQSAQAKHWLEANQFKASHGDVCLLPDKNGNVERVICGVDEMLNIWSIAHLPTRLPAAAYALTGKFSKEDATQLALGWALACYHFKKYKKNGKTYASLVQPVGCDLAYVKSMAEGMCWARDLINTPANDMNPEALSKEAADWGKEAGGRVTVIKGDALLKQNYPMIYTVGKASSVPPHLVDIRFPKKGAKKVTLVGKGVCFDSGGLDIKPTNGMKMMKKDMGGAAALLALAKTIIDTKLNVELRVLLPIVENAVAGNAMRPLDIVPTRKGITVEIGNTDAEGRLILCDALYEADSEKPDLIIDCATLTGAARVALGADVPAFFTPDDALATSLQKHSNAQYDPLWRLPLHKAYRGMLDCSSADLSNDPDSSYGGAITAALYLQEFVTNTSAWIHVDMMAWNLNTRPGRPQGGEAMAIRALYGLLKEKYGK
jgi:leucyl aminopeptidase